MAKKDSAKTHCIRGHPLIHPNIKVNSEGWRECKKCARARYASSRKERRSALKWLRIIIEYGEAKRKYGNILE